jgi:hypothetical protein
MSRSRGANVNELVRTDDDIDDRIADQERLVVALVAELLEITEGDRELPL